MDELEKETRNLGLAAAKRRYPKEFAEGSVRHQRLEIEEKRAATTDPHELGKLGALRRHGRVN